MQSGRLTVTVTEMFSLKTALRTNAYLGSNCCCCIRQTLRSTNIRRVRVLRASSRVQEGLTFAIKTTLNHAQAAPGIISSSSILLFYFMIFFSCFVFHFLFLYETTTSIVYPQLECTQDQEPKEQHNNCCCDKNSR